MAKKKKTTKKTTKKSPNISEALEIGDRSGKEILKILLLVVGLPLGFLIMFNLATLGGLLTPPSEGTGSFQVICIDSISNDQVNGTFDLIYFDNESYYLQDQNQSIELETDYDLICFVNISGYYPSTIAIEARTNEIYENVITLNRIMNFSDIDINFIQLDSEYGNYDSSDLNNIDEEIEFVIEIDLNDSFNRLGKISYLPNCTLDSESYSYVNQSLYNSLTKQEGLWLAISSNIDISNVTIEGRNSTILEYVDFQHNGEYFSVISIPSVVSYDQQTISLIMDSIGENVEMYIFDGNLETQNHIIAL